MQLELFEFSLFLVGELLVGLQQLFEALLLLVNLLDMDGLLLEQFGPVFGAGERHDGREGWMHRDILACLDLHRVDQHSEVLLEEILNQIGLVDFEELHVDSVASEVLLVMVESDVFGQE